MIQILLILVGLFISSKGSLKVSDTKTLSRPNSTYLGLIIIAYGLSQVFIPHDTLVYGLLFYGSLILISSVFISKANNTQLPSNTTNSSSTTWNFSILIGFVILVMLVWYWSMSGGRLIQW